MKEEILIEWNPWWTGRFEPSFVQRESWTRMERWLDRKEIIPITGSRRSGKTTLMYVAIAHLLERVPRENILFIKCDDDRVREDNLIESAREKHRELFNPAGRVYLFLDEIQELPNWDRTLKRIYDLHDDIKIFFTGSRLLKAELGTSLAGRYAHIDVYPFSFKEYLRCRGIDAAVEATGMVSDTTSNAESVSSFSKAQLLSLKSELTFHLREYLEWGGFPEIVLEPDPGRKRELLRFYSDSILYRDVIMRSGITKIEVMEKLKNFLLANISNPVSYSKLGKLFGVSADTVSGYVHAMEGAYFIFPVPVFSYSIRKQLVNPKKIYCIDSGIRNAAGFRFSSDTGRLYENAVFLRLKQMYGDVYHWTTGREEVDFIVYRGDVVTAAIQVCSELGQAEKREVSGLVAAMDEFGLEEGLIINGDTREVRELGEKRIRFVPLWEWLLEEG